MSKPKAITKDALRTKPLECNDINNEFFLM